MVTVRPATHKDMPAVASLHAASARELGRTHYDDRQVLAWAGRKDPEKYPYDEPGEHFVVAELDGEVVGFGHLAVDDGEVRAVYVKPAAARRGVGSALLAHLEGTARDAGLDGCYLWASLNAVPFYRQAGWDVVGADVVETTGNGVTAELAVKLMEKKFV
ncbi:GNAT family N-acetyltransferase [Haloarchaeobius sp. HME9146]|uniref:GNAT family N-acetyltransferase n=1 Tax=Haloarchaeobius sp. HME9146 TaxID=2978732 RepID=UPI0021C09BB6|nr:GNAT family N-acetyltransferase [Haloarchaeobius sp. HME9146]MCT9095438.1 GNAT family N-acetyltransferase [Haloarchaeobius sp. HME9146]